MVDDEHTVKERNDICRHPSCHISSDDRHMNECQMGFSNGVKSNQIKSNQIKSNQIKSNQIKSNQIKSNQIKSLQVSAIEESLVGGHASDVITTFHSSLDWYVEHLHLGRDELSWTNGCKPTSMSMAMGN
jgi:hypothetical protein